MRSRRTGVIGVLVADFEPFSAEILKGVGTALHDSRYDLLAYSGSRQDTSEGWERRSLSRLSGTLIDGAIMVTPTVVNVSAEVPDRRRRPAHRPRRPADRRVRQLHAAPARRRAYLIDLGHRRIGFVSGRPDLDRRVCATPATAEALSRPGSRSTPSLVGVGCYEADTGRQAATRLLCARPPTAVFAANDLSAIAIIEVAAELGLDVPRDLSVVGFDDVPEASRTSAADHGAPAHAAPRRDGGRPADRADGGRDAVATHMRLPTRLVCRGTTAPPAA